jgi:chromate reductase, NAD(P)H dehydrogenase (quinone)
MSGQLHVLVICGSLRKDSYNAALTRALPGLAPPEIKLVTAPPFETLPLYNADIQEASGFPGSAEDLATTIRAADAVLFVTPEADRPGHQKRRQGAACAFAKFIVKMKK